MTAADAGPAWWIWRISECVACAAVFRDGPEQAGVCHHCGPENHYSDEAH